MISFVVIKTPVQQANSNGYVNRSKPGAPSGVVFESHYTENKEVMDGLLDKWNKREGWSYSIMMAFYLPELPIGTAVWTSSHEFYRVGSGDQ